MKSPREEITHPQNSKVETSTKGDTLVHKTPTPWSDKMVEDKSNEEQRVNTNPIMLSKPKWPNSYNTSTSRRTPSISSLSSISSYNSSIQEHSPSSTSSTPSTPFHSISTVGSIPFSWESFPGIPKPDSAPCRNRTRNRNHNKQLPLPPVFSTTASNNKLIPPSPNRRDPFFSALVECSKSGGGHDGGACDDSRRKGRRVRKLNSISCENASAVVDSLVLISRAPRRIGYDVLNKSSYKN